MQGEHGNDRLSLESVMPKKKKNQMPPVHPDRDVRHSTFLPVRI